METEQLKTLAIALLIIGILALGFYSDYLSNQSKETVEVEKEIALLDVDVYAWGEDIDDSSVLFFDYWVYNYGNIESKNVKVRCKLFDINYNLKVSILDNFGSIASNSMELDEVVTENIHTSKGEEFYSSCYVESCDDCRILYKSIPEMIESYEDN